MAKNKNISPPSISELKARVNAARRLYRGIDMPTTVQGDWSAVAERAQELANTAAEIAAHTD